MAPARTLVAALFAAPLLAGCGGDDGDGDARPTPRADRPVVPPPGWRTVENRRAGFTLAAPRSWTARTRGTATLVRSRDRLVAVSLAADRSADGREVSAARYARRALESLPDFEGRVSPRTRRLRASPYEAARVDGFGALRTSRSPQRIAVVAYRRPRLVTYAAVAFRNARLVTRRDEATLDRVLLTLRG